MTSIFRWAAVALAASACLNASATEGGGSIYPHGVENYMAGALPPPGVYGIVYGESYSADRVNDAQGNDLHVPDFKVTANVIALRPVWVTGQKIAGGDLVLHTIVPLVDLDVKVAGVSQGKTGVGDITVGAGLGFHHSANLHSIVALDVILPTGGYDKTDQANIGRNYRAVEPVLAVSWVDPGGFNADAKFGYLINSRNKDTDYRSGREFHFDYSLGWGLGSGWTAGVGGYYHRQMSDDNVAGADVANSRAKALAIGPSVKYDSGQGWFVTAKWQKETGVENRAQGRALWLKAVFPF
jgi:hypothetical protein